MAAGSRINNSLRRLSSRPASRRPVSTRTTLSRELPHHSASSCCEMPGRDQNPVVAGDAVRMRELGQSAAQPPDDAHRPELVLTG